ncbi:MAG: penicillin-binding protein activator [Burkholderiaceae bacterium]
MLGEVRVVYRLAAIVSGLCLLISGCATPGDANRGTQNASVAAKPAPVLEVTSPIAQAGPGSPTEAPGVEVLPVLAPQAQITARIGLLLPLHSEALGTAASVVRDGFMAAAEREASIALSVEVVDSGEAPEDVLGAYGNALQRFDIVVGPLTRSGVAAIAQSGTVGKPTIALAQAEMNEEGRAGLPRQMLAMGLSVEDEARRMAGWMQARKPVGKAIVLATPTAWQRRAAKAFAERWQQLGYEAELMELDIAAQGTYLGASGLIQLQKRLQTETPPFLFSALDAVQTRQMRMLIGTDIPVFGTSQLNPLTLLQWSIADPSPEMNGVRLLDMPWLLQADHPAVMAYSQSASSSGQQRDADMERLYALGIDAFRVAREVALGQMQFQIDGVTGKLRVGFDKPSGRFERIEMPAVYREGRVVPAGGTQ